MERKTGRNALLAVLVLVAGVLVARQLLAGRGQVSSLATYGWRALTGAIVGVVAYGVPAMVRGFRKKKVG